MANDPSTVIPAVQAMREDWTVVDALMGGTKAMRKAGELFLPKWPKEEADAYKDRLNLSTLLPAYSETVQNMTGRVFADEITLGDDVPGDIVTLCDNIDRQGNNLQVWAQDLFRAGIADGLCHVLVDYPQAEGIKTKADEIAAGVRPYAVIIKGSQVLGWRTSGANGEQALSMFRYKETVEESDPENEFSTKSVNQIRVLEPGKWATYRKVDGGKGNSVWAMYESGTTTLKQIPITTFYTKRTGFMTATPPLLELAHLNIKHWQSQSDQDNILHIARVPMLAVIGVEDSYELKVGTGSATNLPVDGDMKWVEHTGKAIEAGRQSLLDMLDDMRIAGAKLLHKEKQVTKTATQAEDEEAQEMSPLQTMAGQLEDAIDQVLQFFAMWLKQTSGGKVKVNGNFEIDYAPETTLPFLISMVNAGLLSKESFFAEVKRRGVVNSDIVWEEEKDRISTQGPALGAL
ncbi:DUF4055 domain-containing protein [Pseudomonas segetis]